MRHYLILLIVCLPALVFARQLPPEFEQLITRFDNGEILEGTMEHLFRDGFTGEQTFHTGSLLLSRDRYLISVDGQTIYVDGELSRVYNASENKVIISRYYPEEDEFAPSRFFSAPDEIYQVFSEKADDGSLRITLRTSDPFELFPEVVITLTANGVPLEIHALDQTENTFTTVFENAQFYPADSITFEFSYPPSAEILDLRE